MAKKKASRKSAKKKSASKKTARKKVATKKKSAPKKKSRRKAVGKKTVRSGASNCTDLMQKLQPLLEKPDTEKQIIELLAPLDETQRKAVAPHCISWLQIQKRTDFIEDPPGTFRRWNPLNGPIEVAVFCVASLTNIKKLGRRSLPSGDLVVEILKLRKPKWADQIADMLLEGTYYWGSWRTVREMVKLKLCPKPNNTRYYTGMITGLCGWRWGGQDRKTALAALRADPSLLKDEVWKLFEYEGDGENTLANIDRWEKTSWSGALATLSKEGKLSRPKLLAATLGALELGFNHYRAKWFFTFFDLLEPTNRELKKHADTILDLVGSPTPNVATWAFEKATAMYERGLVKDASRLGAAASPLLMAKQKGTVQKTLKFLGQLAENSPESAGEICVLSADAMGHEKVDVQKSAFKLISKHATASDPQVQDAVRKYLPLVAASFRKQLTEWLESADSSASETPSKKKSARTASFDRSRLKKYPASHRALMKIGELVAALDGTSEKSAVAIPAATFDGTEIPRLDVDRKMTPISDVEELIEVCGRVLEDSSLIDDGERAIDGISRLHGEKPDDFADLVGPLLKRTTTLFTKRHKVPFAGESITADLCGLIHLWVHPRPVTVPNTKNMHGTPQLEIHGVFDEPFSTWRTHATPLTFLSQRSLELARRLSAAPAPLLSAPTHEGGWIDPAEWVRRINSLKNEPGEADLILSLLRLAPGGREAGLKSLKTKLKGEWVNAVKYALGGKVQIGKSAPMWIAAARARTPLIDDPKVSKAFPKYGPDSGKAPQFQVRYFEEKYAGKTLKQTAVDAVAKRPKKLDVMVPTQLLYRNQMEDSSVSFWDLGIEPGSLNWVESISPLDCNAFFAAGGQCLVDNLDWWEAAWHNRCFLNPLLDPDTPPGNIGLFMLFCGLAAKEPGEHGLAVDITIQAINDGRLGTDNLRDTIAQHAPSGVFNLTRLATRYQDVATASDLHALVVMLAWEQALGEEFDQSLRGLGNILELLCELGSQLHRGIDSTSCRTYLESFSGSNKTAKAAKQLLALSTSSSPAECLQQALENRLDRIKIWASR